MTKGNIVLNFKQFQMINYVFQNINYVLNKSFIQNIQENFTIKPKKRQ